MKKKKPKQLVLGKEMVKARQNKTKQTKHYQLFDYYNI
jgi:hypothetical protein